MTEFIPGTGGMFGAVCTPGEADIPATRGTFIPRGVPLLAAFIGAGSILEAGGMFCAWGRPCPGGILAPGGIPAAGEE